MALYVLHSVGQGGGNSKNQIKKGGPMLMFFVRSILNNHADTIKQRKLNHISGLTLKKKNPKNFSACEYVAIHPLMNGHAKENRDAIRAFSWPACPDLMSLSSVSPKHVRYFTARVRERRYTPLWCCGFN